MDNEHQTYLCDFGFIEKSCREERHDECNEEWEGPEGPEPKIRIKCSCGCHEENKKLLTVRSKAAEQGRQSKLENFGESNCIET